MGKQKRPKKVQYELIAATSEIGRPMYSLLRQIVRQHHDEIHNTNARIALAWATGWKADVDGRIVIGKCKKASDLDRELQEFDFVILLSKDFWRDASEKQRTALVDHELTHAAVKYDADGEPVLDERGRQVFRTRRHDLEEFSDVVGRHGLYKKDLEQFARALDKARQASGNVWIGFASLKSRLENAGFNVPVDSVIHWTEDQRRTAHEWLEIRRELLKANSGAAQVPPVPTFVTAAVVQPTLVQQSAGA